MQLVRKCKSNVRIDLFESNDKEKEKHQTICSEPLPKSSVGLKKRKGVWSQKSYVWTLYCIFL